MKNKKAVIMLLGGLFSISVTQLEASEFNYNFIEFGASDAEFFDVDDTDPKIFLNGSVDISKNVNLVGSLSTQTLDSSGGVDFDQNEFTIGIGYHAPVSTATDLTAKLVYIDKEFEFTNGSASATATDGSGYGVGLGVRHKLSSNFEMNGSVDFTSFDEFVDDKDTAVSIGGRYYFSDKFSAGLNYISGDFQGAGGSLRYQF